MFIRSFHSCPIFLKKTQPFTCSQILLRRDQLRTKNKGTEDYEGEEKSKDEGEKHGRGRGRPRGTGKGKG